MAISRTFFDSSLLSAVASHVMLTSMAGFIVLDDGRAYAAANWAFRATVEAIADALPSTAEGSELAEWLRNDPTVQIYHNVDVRELAPTSHHIFLAAAEVALQHEREKGPVDWEKSELWEGWVKRFAEFIEMIGRCRRGEPPGEFNPHMRDTLPPTGDRIGPGW